jgi:flagellar FliL protein
VSDQPAEAAAPPKSKKLLLIVVVTVVVLALAAAGGWFYISKQRAALDGDEEAAPAKKEVQGPPVYLPMDSMVVNLADPGGEKVAQVGITLELSDSGVVEKVKQYMPTIRSSVLLLISQRTSEELLQREGKEKLQADVLREALRPFGVVTEDEEVADDKVDQKAAKKTKVAKKPKSSEPPPVKTVLFSSFIVQ